MSTLKVDGIRSNSGSSDAITLASDGTCTANITNRSNRNKIINGAMQVSQRYGTTATPISNAIVLDRFQAFIQGGGAISVQQITDDAPTGFKNSMKILATTADSSIAGTDQLRFHQVLEDKNIEDLNWGSSNAKTITVSFWVKSSVTGTYCLNVVNYGSWNRSYIKEYTVSSANTWEKKTVTFTGDTSGTWGHIRLSWVLMSGTSQHATGNQWNADALFATSNQVNWAATQNNTFYITGVQVEVGSVATDFEHKPYAQELALCQRYFYAHSGGAHTVNGSDSSTPNSVLSTASCQSTSSISVAVPLPVPMRAVPSLYSTVAGSTRYRLNSSGANTNSGSDPVVWTAGSSHTTVQMDLAGFSGLSAGQAGTVRRYDGTGILGFNAEL